MDIQHKHGETKGEFYIEGDGDVLGKITYSRSGPARIIIDHTEVSDELRGTGAGKKLVEHAVNYARKNHLEVLPLCPFAKAMMERNPEMQDVLMKG